MPASSRRPGLTRRPADRLPVAGNRPGGQRGDGDGRVELVPVGPAQESALLALARAFHAEDGHPLSERGEAASG